MNTNGDKWCAAEEGEGRGASSAPPLPPPAPLSDVLLCDCCLWEMCADKHCINIMQKMSVSRGKTNLTVHRGGLLSKRVFHTLAAFISSTGFGHRGGSLKQLVVFRSHRKFNFNL